MSAGSFHIPRAESSAPFGITRQPSNRIEMVFLLRGGGNLTVFQESREPVSEAMLEELSQQLASQVGQAGAQRSFCDAWIATGQRTWVDLSQVAAFSIRPAR